MPWSWSDLRFTCRSTGYRLQSSSDVRRSSWWGRSSPTIRRGDWWRGAASPEASLKPSFVMVAVILDLALRGAAMAADPRFPDWPCVQIKVPEISIAAVWSGPSIDDVVNAWEEDPIIRDL